jgi:hypothetical protein
MKDNNVETMLRFSKEKGVKDLKIDRNYITTIYGRLGTCFVGKYLCTFGLMMFA